jgi:uncharacterized protein YndB with AHSA1/START domain
MSTKAESAEETIEIKKTIVIDASPQAVFKAITDPSELTNWFPDNAVFEGSVGGQVRFSFNKEGSKKVKEGIVKEFVPNKKVSYTWPLDIPGFPGKEEGKLSMKEYDQDWSYFLGRLKDYREKENN